MEERDGCGCERVLCDGWRVERKGIWACGLLALVHEATGRQATGGQGPCDRAHWLESVYTMCCRSMAAGLDVDLPVR